MGKILEKGETGFGILFESDAGYIDHSLNKNLVDRLIKESISFKEDEPVLVNCILQKWGVKNKNGRIYPKDVLVPEVGRYMELVELNSAVAEADHPECVTSSLSMIYTKSGWKKIEEISDDESILTLNTATNKIELQQIQKNIQKPYKGLMYEFKSKNSIDLTVTPNHRFLLENKKGKRFYLTAQEIYDNVGNVYHSGRYKILKKAEWIGEYKSHFILPGLPKEYFSPKHSHSYEKFKEEIQIKSEDWYAFLGIYLAEGHSTGVKTRKNLKGFDVRITQKKKEMIFMI